MRSTTKIRCDYCEGIHEPLQVVAICDPKFMREAKNARLHPDCEGKFLKLMDSLQEWPE
jgi:hypothetical protein